MTSAAVMSKLNAKTCRFDVGRGGIPDITPEDVAGALAGLPEVAYRLGLVKYAGQEAEVSRLTYWTRDLAVDMAIRLKWGKPKPGYLEGIARYAIWQCVDPLYCGVCHGAGLTRDEWGQSVTCIACNGNLRRYVTDAEEAEVAGIPIADWGKWRERGRALYEILDYWDHKLQRKLNYQLKEC